jgi:hypothetical protein
VRLYCRYLVHKEIADEVSKKAKEVACCCKGHSRSTIFAHADQAGQAAANRWTEQLKDIATFDRFNFF